MTRHVCRGCGRPAAREVVRGEGRWVVCCPGEPLAWPQPFRIAAHYWLNDPKFTADQAGNAYYFGTTPRIAEEVRGWLERWGEYPPQFPVPVSAPVVGLYGPGPRDGRVA